MELLGRWKLTSEFRVSTSEDDLFRTQLGQNSILKSTFAEGVDVQITMASDIAEDLETINFQVLANGSLAATESYTMGCFNHQVDDDEVTVVILQNLKEPYRKFSLLRLGPGRQECCCEHFILERSDILRVAVAAATPDGVTHTISRFFRRDERYEVARKKLEQAHRSLGWDVLKYWPCTAIELCELKVTRVLGVIVVPESKRDTLWSLEQSVEDIKKTTYSSELYVDPANQLYFSIQITSGKSAWKVRRTHSEVLALLKFIRDQDTTADSIFQRPPPKFAWKSYVEFHRMVLAIENLLRNYFQNASVLNQNHVHSLCVFFEIPEHLDTNQVRIVETMIEEDVEPAEDAQKFVSYRLDYLKIEKLRLPIDTASSTPAGAPSPLSSATTTASLSPASSQAAGTATATRTLDGKRGPSIYQSNPFGPRGFPLAPRRRSSVSMATEAADTTGERAYSTDPPPQEEHKSAQPSTLHAVHSISSLSTDGSHSFRPSDTSAGRAALMETAAPVAASLPMQYEMDDSSQSTPSSITFTASIATGSPGKIQKSYSGTLDEINELYGSKPIEMSIPGLKVMPIDMVATSNVKSNIARGLLYGALERGIVFIKHSRQGQPKRKVLKCDPGVTRLYWVGEKEAEDPLEDNKFVDVSQIEEIRPGTEIDPLTSDEALQQAAANGTLSTQKLLKVVEQKEKLGLTNSKPKPAGLFGFLKVKEEGILYGTATLRRTCKPEHLSLCISLILPDRTLDMQFLTQKEYNLVLINLREITKPPTAPSPVAERPHTLHSMHSQSIEGSVNPLKQGGKTLKPRKSVRFTSEDDNLAATEGGDRGGQEEKEDTAPAEEDQEIPLPQTNSYASLASRSASLGEDSTIFSNVIYTMPSDGNMDHLLDRGAGPSSTTARNPRGRGATHAAAASRGAAGRDLHINTNQNARDAEREEENRSRSPIRMSSSEAIQIGMILHEQEKKYKTNMYESLVAEDQPTVRHYVDKGYTTEEAIFRVFNRKFGRAEGEAAADDEESVEPRSGGGTGRNSSFFPQVLNGDAQAGGSSSSAPALNFKLKANEALQIGLLLAQQEEEYGTNMYDSLLPEDEAKIREMTETQGMTMYEAILDIFTKRYVQNTGNSPANADTSESPRGLQRVRSSFFPNTNSVLPANVQAMAPANAGQGEANTQPRRLNSNEAMELALLLSEQESRTGTNMYDSLKAEDEPELQSLLQQNYSMEKAVEIIFNRKYGEPPAMPVATAYAQPLPGGPGGYGPPPGHPAGMYMAPPSPYGYPPSGPYFDPQYGAQYSPQGYPPMYGYPPGYGYGYGGYSPSPYGAPPGQGYPPYGQQPGPGGYPGGYGYPSPGHAPPYGAQPPRMAPGMHQAPYPQAGQPPRGPPQVSPGMQQPGRPRPPPAPTPASAQAPLPNMPGNRIRADSNNDSFYGEIVPTELTALVHGSEPPRPQMLNRMTSNLGPMPAQPRPGMPGQPNSFNSSQAPAPANPSSASSTSASNPVAVAAVAEAAPLSSVAPRPKLSKKLSIFSRKSSTNDTAAAFGLSSKNLKYKEADVNSIMQMGFTRDQAVWALVQNDNNVVNAIMSLTR